MNGERYRGASLRSGLSMRHEGKPPARASNGGAGYSGSHIVLERMIAMAGPPQRGRFTAIGTLLPRTRRWTSEIWSFSKMYCAVGTALARACAARRASYECLAIS
jgi:hypothetical protein